MHSPFMHTGISEVLAERAGAFPMDKHGPGILRSLGEERVLRARVKRHIHVLIFFNPHFFLFSSLESIGLLPI